MIIIGPAGTGKSFLISAIKFKLMDKLILSTTTGKAALNLGMNSETIHSLLLLPVKNSRNRELKINEVLKLRKVFKNVKYIILDEYSMLGQVSFFWIDNRLRQISGNDSKKFGGLILF